MTTKKVYSSSDANPIVLHAKRDADSEIAHPVLVGTNGELLVAEGLIPTTYDYISLTYSGSNITTAVYKVGGSGGTTVASLALTYSGNNITSVTRT
jgi:hypothetical protein